MIDEHIVTVFNYGMLASSELLSCANLSSSFSPAAVCVDQYSFVKFMIKANNSF